MPGTASLVTVGAQIQVSGHAGVAPLGTAAHVPTRAVPVEPGVTAPGARKEDGHDGSRRHASSSLLKLRMGGCIQSGSRLITSGASSLPYGPWTCMGSCESWHHPSAGPAPNVTIT